MKRRTVLAAVGGTVVLSGCLGSDGGDGSGDPATTTQETESRTDGSTTQSGPRTDDSTDGSGTASETATTETSTGGTTVTDTTFEILRAECGTGTEEATVERSADSVTVEGLISGNNSCYTAELEGVDYDGNGEEMTVRVRSFSTADEGEGCAACIMDIEYRVDVAYDGAEPGTVDVRHNGEQVASE